MYTRIQLFQELLPSAKQGIRLSQLENGFDVQLILWIQIWG